MCCLFELMFNVQVAVNNFSNVMTFSCSTYSNEDNVICSVLYHQLDSNLFQYFIVIFAYNG